MALIDDTLTAWILDDGDADLTDRVGSNDLSLKGVGEPAWGGSNDGLVFDGTDDYCSFTPPFTNWQGGCCVAILCTLPDEQDKTVLQMDQSTDADRHFRVHSNFYTSYNRASFAAGREYNALIIQCQLAGTDSTKQWIFAQYDNDNTDGEIYSNKTAGTQDTDVAEYGTMTFNRGRLGQEADGAGEEYSGTIYKVYFFNRYLTQQEMDDIVDDVWSPIAASGWAHKYCGVASPGKVDGVANASIGKVMGVAV